MKYLKQIFLYFVPVFAAVSGIFAFANAPYVIRDADNLSIRFSEPVLSWSLQTESGENCAAEVAGKPVLHLDLKHIAPTKNLLLHYTTSTGEYDLFVETASSLSSLPKPNRSVNIYQLPIRTYFAQGVGFGNRGKFTSIDAEFLHSLKEKGVDYLWLTGVQQQASHKNTDPDVVKGDAGSYYAITDSWSVSDDLGSLKDFLNVVKLAHSNGIRVMMDLVVNHTARVHRTNVACKQEFDIGGTDDVSEFFDSQNNYFYLTNSASEFLPPDQLLFPGADGRFDTYPAVPGIQPEFPARVTGNNVIETKPNLNDWFETAKLNYGYNFTNGQTSYHQVPKTWSQVSNIAEYWLRLGIDGFRVDFAHAVPIEFWRHFTAHVRAVNSEVFLLAEAYESDIAMKTPGFSYEAILDAGFDSVYNSEFYWSMRNLVRHNRPPVMANYDRSPAMRRAIQRKGYMFTNYLENHDEVRLASQHFAVGLSSKEFRSNVGFHYSVFSALLPGNFMMQGGQEFLEDASILGEFNGDNGKTSIFDFVHQSATFSYLQGSGSIAAKNLAAKYQRLMLLKQGAPFSTPNSLGNSSYANLEFSNRQRGKDQWLGVYSRFSDEGKYLVVLNSDPVSAHETTIHFTQTDGHDSGGVLEKLGIQNSDKRYLFVEVLNRRNWIPEDPNIKGVGVPGAVLYQSSNIPSGLYLGKIPPATAYVFKVIEY